MIDHDDDNEAKEFNFNEDVIFRTLRSKGFLSNCNFAFNSQLLVIGGKNANPLKYDMTTGEISEIGKRCSSQTDSITAIAISQNSEFAATGYPDGTIILWNIKTSGCDGNPYKLIHKSTITNMAFILDHKRLIIADDSGMITLLSLVQSLSCELVLQTTIINLKKPILSFVSLDKNHVAFSSIDMFSFITVDRNITVHISKSIQAQTFLHEDESAHFSSAIISEKRPNDETNDIPPSMRALLCTNKILTLYEVESDKKYTELLVKDNFQANIVQCFFMTYDRLLVVLDNGQALLLDITGRVIHCMTNLPTDVVPSNIQKCGHSLIFFLDNAIFQKTIPQ